MKKQKIKKYFMKSEYLVLKSWDELKKEYSSFINTNYYSTEEIEIKTPHGKYSSSFFINIEVQSELGKSVRMRPENNNIFNNHFRIADNSQCTTIIKKMVKRIPNKEKDPECFI